ncbi:MAG: hypothetical protein H6833_13095 [Planctomycetes bacterium]|nr:hypothetical protein [Planctomycetota bacterium]
MVEQVARRRARELGIEIEGHSMTTLIHAIQEREGYSRCFSIGKTACPEYGCAWRASCIWRKLENDTWESQREFAKDSLPVILHPFDPEQRLARRLARMESREFASSS